MYDELIKSLHCCFGFEEPAVTDCENCMMKDKREEHNYVGCCDALGLAAADAIEELGRLADAIPHVCECCIGCEVESGGGCDRVFVLSPKRAREYLSKPRWISVTERLPEVRTWVLCYCRANSFDVFRMTDEGDWQYGNRSIYMKGYVTHWMPLPQPPKEE